MLSANRRGMQKTRGIRRIRERKMNSRTIKLTILTSIGEIALTGCVTEPVTGERKISKAAIGGVGGALGGYLLGDLIGGKNSRTEEIVGTGIGPVAGAGEGYSMDKQEKKLGKASCREKEG